MSQALYDLPAGWEWKRLGDVADTTSGGTPSRGRSDYWNGSIPWIKSGELGDSLIVSNSEFITEEGLKNSSAKIFSKGSLLLALYGATAGKLGVLDFDAATNQAVCCITPRCDLLFRDYIKHFLFSQREKIIKDSFGGAQPNISQGYVREIIFPLPPLAEQIRIVEKLDAVLSRIYTAIDELQQSLALVDAMFKSGLDGVFEDVYAHSAIKKLSELTTKIGSGATPKGGGSAYKESGISLIRSLNVHDLNFKYDGLAFIDDEQAKALSNVEVSSGDVLLNITGASIARCCIVPDGILPARVNQHVCILRPNHLLNSEFLNYLIVSPKFKSALLFQGAGGATRQALTKAMIENFDIPLPTLDRQEEVIETIKQLNDKTTQLKTELTAKIGMFNQLKASVLDGAFRGEV